MRKQETLVRKIRILLLNVLEDIGFISRTNISFACIFYGHS
jgi:hypothetical protein